ncbi:MBL fold metallo-hydrolase [Agaricicola taiwanensis]|uniref:MBL fold metallo-hydrolase n=1 Tax=Agaricicola taiwanensis TaxID=591372 RepID=A0A8J2YE58_9RHOB|nr:MBL fold metallo-hydrolase [Agaricicola taiwanensis]GGE35905.1 MBL fold metallo-hydrolase [Agaricicola taiwanensis]
MSTPLALDHTFDDRYGILTDVAPGIRRVLAPNPGPFTFNGTATHIVGRGRVAVIDPGPNDDRHLNALLAALKGETVSHIFLTHTHRDHSGGLQALAEATGAMVAGCRPLSLSSYSAANTGTVEAGHEPTYQPDHVLSDGESVRGQDWSIMAIATPGHASNHLAFALDGTGILFPGDHVMGWSTTVIAPPDGSLSDYMRSMDRLLARDDRLFLPAHGAPVTAPRRLMRALKSHRRTREGSIRARLAAGDRTIAQIVEATYPGLDPRLKRAAGLSVLAHLIDLVDRGLVISDSAPHLDGLFEPA